MSSASSSTNDPLLLRDELMAIYHELDALIASFSPVCQASGRCCRFTEYGHTLFLSQPEADLLLEPGLPPGSVVSKDFCPFQIAGQCTARDRRPMGCRIYYCDPNFQDQQPEITERFISRLKALHERTNTPWRYRPLVQFLEEVPCPTADPVNSGRLVVLGNLP
jgi:Fe-S-cluster containining protein